MIFSMLEGLAETTSDTVPALEMRLEDVRVEISAENDLALWAREDCADVEPSARTGIVLKFCGDEG
jgi:hypothetical protein